MEKLIENVKNSWDKLLTCAKEDQTQNHLLLTGATSILDDAVVQIHFERKKSDVIAIIDHILEVLQKHGDLISKNQSMTISNYFLCKVWIDIIYGATSESGYGKSPIYIYTNTKDAQGDTIQSQKIYDFLHKLKDSVSGVTKYSSLILLLYMNQKSFMSLERNEQAL